MDLRLTFEIKEYDPAIPGKDSLPEPADIVVCSDVLEHIEPNYLLNVLVDFNAIEYYFLTKSSISIKLRYKDFEPILKSIKCLKGYTNKNIKSNNI